MKNLHFIVLLLFLAIFNSCENEPFQTTDLSNVILVDSELYELIERVARKDFENEITCIDFNYPFTLIVYDSNMDILAYEPIDNDHQFSIFLDNLDQGKSISLSYPITSILNNGHTYEINNNEELKEAIDKCVEVDTLITCNTILTEVYCIWHLTHLQGPNSQYHNSYFQTSNYGNAGLYFNNGSFDGTWITYFIEGKLHLNIFITGDQNVGDHWNFDWNVISFTDSEMEITNGTDQFLLTKECPKPCKKFLFEECESTPGSGKAIFDLESYTECFFPLSGLSDIFEVTLSYYETYDDMIAGTNPLVNLHHENTTNPQLIYIRFDDINSGMMVGSISIILKAINC